MPSHWRSFKASWLLTAPQVFYADRMKDGDALKHPLILLGGPDANEITDKASKLLRTTLRFGNPNIHEISFLDISAKPPRVYKPNDATSQQSESDLGFICKAPNPFATDKPALIIAGSFGYGTWAAARYLMSSEFLGSRDATYPSLEGLIETDIVLDTPQRIRPLVFRPLN
jgi:hypothetical protein